MYYSKVPCVGPPWQGTVILRHTRDFEELFPLQVLGVIREQNWFLSPPDDDMATVKIFPPKE